MVERGEYISSKVTLKEFSAIFKLRKGNSNVMCLVSFMHKLCQVFAEYFKEVEEESIRDNFVIVYELLDEVMDYGSPQFTDSKVLESLSGHPAKPSRGLGRILSRVYSDGS